MVNRRLRTGHRYAEQHDERPFPLYPIGLPRVTTYLEILVFFVGMALTAYLILETGGGDHGPHQASSELVLRDLWRVVVFVVDSATHFTLYMPCFICCALVGDTVPHLYSAANEAQRLYAILVYGNESGTFLREFRTTLLLSNHPQCFAASPIGQCYTIALAMTFVFMFCALARI